MLYVCRVFICTHPPDVATLDQRNIARTVVVVLGNKKKLEAGFVATRWGRFEVLVDLKHSELVLGGLHGGSRVRPEGPRHFKQMVYKWPRSFDSGTGKRWTAWRSNDIEQRRGLLMAAAVPQVFMLSLK